MPKTRLLFLITIFLFIALYALNAFFNSFYFVFQLPIELRKREFINPFVSEERKIVKKALAKEREFTNPIEKEIFEVFGEKYFDETMRILKCENANLDPKATHKNKDGSVDFGIFMINSYWNGFNKSVNNEKFLLDSSINIRIAWKLFKDSGYSFKLWACEGR